MNNCTKRIMFVTASTTGGGAERMLFNIINSLKNCERQLVITSNDVVPENQVAGVSVVSLKKEHAISAFGGIVKAIRDFKPDYVFSTSSNVGYLLILSKLFCHKTFKVVLRCAVTPCEIYGTSLKDKLLNRVISKTYHKCDTIIAQTEFMKNDLHESYHIPLDKIRVIRNIIDKSFLTKQSEKFVPENFDSQNYNIVAVGALYSVKGFDLLIKAIAPVIKEHPKIKLFILGAERYEIGYKDGLLSLINEMGMNKNISLLGQKSNPYPYIKHADLLVMSSRKEGFPNVVLEALYLHTPVVVSNCVDFSGVVYDGTNGFIVEKNQVDSLTEGIRKALDCKFDMDTHTIENFDYNKLFV